MPEQSDYPDRWQCASDNKRVTVEVRVSEEVSTRPRGGSSIRQLEHRWIEIPTQSVELWVEKGDAARIQRTAKITFPTEWGSDTPSVEHNSPRQLIEQYTDGDTSPFMVARVWFQDGASGDWILDHFGWVGGVGPASNPSNSKLWVYDFAELLSGVPIGLTVNNPTIGEMLSTIAEVTNSNTPIPISNALFIPPNMEELQAFQAQSLRHILGSVDADHLTSLASESDNVLGGQYYPLPTMRGADPLQGDRSDGEYDGSDVPTGRSSQGDQESFIADATINTGSESYDLVDETAEEIYEVGSTAIGDPLTLGDGDLVGAATDLFTPDKDRTSTTKSWTANHDTLLDVYDWFEKNINGKLHFEPDLNSTILVADVEPSRRVWAQDELVDRIVEEGPPPNLTYLPDVTDTQYGAHGAVGVRTNDALYEMKPTNTLHLRGSSSQQSRARSAAESAVETTIDAATGDFFGAANSLGGLFDNSESESPKYPVIKVQSPSLLEAAEGVELSPEAVESDATSLDTAEKEAIQELTNLLEETSEGNIVLDGKPRIMPYDRVDAFEVCSGDVTFEPQPVGYEVESVKHVKSASSGYETHISVSIWANEKTIETERKAMVEVE